MKSIIRQTMLLLVSAFLLTSCGGGGGGGGVVGGGGGGGGGTGGVTFSGVTTQASLTSDNANKIFSLVWNGGPTAGTISSSPKVAKTAPYDNSKGGGIVPLAKCLVKNISINTKGLSGSSKNVSSVIPVFETQTGAVSGTLTMTGSVDDTTGTGSITESFADFNDGDGYTYDGNVQLQINGFDLVTGAMTDVTMSFTLWTIKSASDDISLTGSMRMQESLQNKSDILTVNMDGRDNIGNETFRFANFVVTSVYDNLFSPTFGTATYSGRVYAEKFGYVEISTVSPCIYSDPNANPSSGGPIILSGAGNSKASVTPISKNLVEIAVDENGDAVFESKNAYAWDNLEGAPVLGGGNTLPVALDDSYTTNENTSLSVGVPGILGNDTDSDGDDLDAILSTGPVHGTLNLDAETGAYAYSPNANYTGNDSFTYWANDGTGNSNLATVTITVNVLNAGVKIIGTEETVFDWTTNSCEPEDIPDLPARAFRDNNGKVQLIATHYKNRRMIGDDLGLVAKDCNVVMDSDRDPDPAMYNDNEWINATYSPDGATVYALIHNEYQGQAHPGMCPSGSYVNCWYNSITLAVSHDSGKTYTHVTAPDHLVASVPYQYVPDAGPYGIFEGSNILHNQKDGYFYKLLHLENYGLQKVGACVMRTQDLSDPTSWRAWDGNGFNVRFINPYKEIGYDPAKHVCEPVSFENINKMADSITFNTFFNKFMLVGAASKWDPVKQVEVNGFYYSLSDDLINWSERKLIMECELWWTNSNIVDRYGNPALIDPTDTSRNYSNTGQRPYLYYTRWNKNTSLDRDLIRIQIEFSK